MSSDGDLKQNVLDELKWDPSVTAAHIGITAKDGVVSLSGHVENYIEKFAAEAAAGRVRGVKAIAEELEVRIPFALKKADDEIAAAAIHRLKWNAAVPSNALKIKVEKGWITLTGQVDWHFQKDAAEHDIRWLFGVIGVTNQIAVKPKVAVGDLSADIAKALHRTWFSNPEHVFASAEGGRVELTGNVNTWRERDVAASTAWSAPGVTVVENHIKVG